MYHCLGIDTETRVHDKFNRPVPVLDHGEPIVESDRVNKKPRDSSPGLPRSAAMLNIYASVERTLPGMPRRSFLQLGAGGCGALSVGNLTPLRAANRKRRRRR